MGYVVRHLVRSVPMGLREHIEALLSARGIQGIRCLKARSAVGALLDVLGDVPLNEGPPADSGSIFTVPGDSNRWVATWSYDDGAFDLIKEGASCQDSLIGWKPGQSMRDYQAGLETEDIPELTKEERAKPASPLFSTPPAPPKNKKARKSRAKAREEGDRSA